MDRFLHYNNLFSIYKDLLTDKEKEMFSMYYQDDLSMSEIADNEEVSRSRVGNVIKTVEEKLDNYESIIHKQKMLDSIQKCIKMSDLEEIRANLERII